LLIILPYAATLTIVGLLESLLTASIMDEMTGTRSDRDREVRGQGLANCVAGLFGGMAGCAMIGQSVINVRSGGSGRLSTLVAGFFLLVRIIVFGDIVAQIPMAALVGVMIMVAVGTFDWQSLRDLRKIPRSDAMIMLSTVAIVVSTHDLAKGVIAGVIMAALVFGWKISRISATSATRKDGVKVYTVSGQLFFGTMAAFVDLFAYEDDPLEVRIDLGRSHVWDQSAVAAIAKVREKYRQQGKSVYVTGLNPESQRILDNGFS
jgi:SulP family sulfate permease